ncbi:hypothetical protein [Cytobacillus sp. NCCP-133]|uniref:hypothetical protein n=1 Tax=Cytobacillus sp. NCCP-133 TaxID=766848 RepID=UPI0022318C55|nr:hypothetical protein [Cytobacillus sp. NCCP-133]GLB60090.1 hypothetical protein NCCP133_22220 [Cytobacillus sp. NCCP-133]
MIKFKKIHISTAAMAAVMALGIVTHGVLLNVLAVSGFGRLLSIVDIGLWLAFLLSIAASILKGEFRKIHYANPINRFGIGTWVAGSSICGILIYKQFGGGVAASAVAVLNAGLWLCYMAISLRSFIEIHRSGMLQRVHGILLLTTVSTQSLILLFNTVFEHVPVYFNAGMMIIGLSFYLVSSWFILKRYTAAHWDIADDWNNTNCILHGALSISGLAMMKSAIVSDQFVAVIWLGTFLLFLIVEIIEGYRLAKRIRMYGVRSGVFTYNVTQWSRIFTFAMFFTFTAFLKVPALFSIQQTIIHIGIWIILVLLIIELVLSIQVLQKDHVRLPVLEGERAGKSL